MAALKYVETQKVAHPDLEEWYGDMADLYSRKLWHQLTLKIDKFVALPACKTGDTLIQLYHNFITDFETNINLLKLAHLSVIVSRQYQDRDSALAFLESVIEKLRATTDRRVEEPVVYVLMQVAAVKLQGGDESGCAALLEEGRSSVERLSEVDPSVHAIMNWVTSQYHKSKQEFADFYRTALQYLAYTSLDTLSEPFKLDLAVDLSLAALLGENIYNFGELLAHPLVKVLGGTSFEWLHQILQAFDRGELHEYDQLCTTHAAALNAQPALVANERRLREKITILCLMELISSRPSEDRTIPLAVIAEQTKLPVDGVELLLMKTLSVHLIEGVIDQVEGTVTVDWVQPRVLGPAQVGALRVRLDTWLTKVHSTLLTVEAETPDLLVA